MKKIAYIVLLAAAMTGCRSSKQVVYTPDTNSTSVTTLSGNGNDATPSETGIRPAATWQTMQCGGNVTLNTGKPMSSGMQMRMVRGEVIQISVRPLGLFEAGRLLIKGDSIFAIDKMNKRIVAEQLSAITGGVPLTVGMLQDAFLGREFDAQLGPKFTCDFGHDAQGHVSSLNIHYTGRSAATYQVNYADVRATLAGLVAHQVSIATQMNGQSLGLDLAYNNINWDTTVKIDTTLPDGYRRVDGKQLLSIFKQ